MKKIISILLIAVMLIGMFAGCSVQPNPYKDDPEAAAEALNPSEPENEDRDFGKAYALYEPDYVVGSVHGIDVTWAEYFYLTMNGIQSMEMYVPIDDFNAELGNGMTYAEYIKSFVENSSRQYRAIEHNAAEVGLAITDEDRAVFEAQLAADVAAAAPDGSIEGFYAYLAENYIDSSVYEYSALIGILASKVAAHYCGENFEGITQEELESYATEHGFMAAKHILLKTAKDDGTAMTDEEKAAKKAEAQDVIDRINAGEDFDAYMALLGEDGGMKAYPQGYIFLSGEMVPEFEAETLALEVGEMSAAPVESAYGYHIIKRIPVAANLYYSAGNVAFCQVVGSEKMNNLMAGWMEEAVFEYTEGFELDFEETFNG